MFKRKDGLWQERITLPSGKQKYFYGKTKREVTNKVRTYKEEQEAGKRFDAVVDEWWEDHEKTITPNTARGYRSAIARAKLRFSGQSITQIRPHDINSFLLDYIQQEHPAKKTAINQLLICNLVFRYAVARGYIDNNPARDLSVPRGLPQKQREIPPDDDIRRVEANASHPFGLFALWALYTGLRRGELLGLKWDDVDLTARTVTVSRSVYWVSNTPQLKEPKTRAGIRTVAIPDALYKHLTPGKGWIWPDKDSGELMTHGHFNRAWKRYCEDTGVSITPHQLRHAYATMLYDNDIPVKDAQTLLGHARASTTQDVYTHVRKEREKAVNQRILSLKFG